MDPSVQLTTIKQWLDVRLRASSDGPGSNRARNGSHYRRGAPLRGPAQVPARNALSSAALADRMEFHRGREQSRRQARAGFARDAICPRNGLLSPPALRPVCTGTQCLDEGGPVTPADPRLLFRPERAVWSGRPPPGSVQGLATTQQPTQAVEVLLDDTTAATGAMPVPSMGQRGGARSSGGGITANTAFKRQLRDSRLSDVREFQDGQPRRRERVRKAGRLLSRGPWAIGPRRFFK